jgi:hypothetical protein
VLDAAAVHAGEFAIRPLVVDEAFERHELAFQDDLGVGRHHHVDGLAFYHLGRRAVKGTEDLEVVGVGGHADQSRDLVDGWSADDDRNLQVLSLCRGCHGVQTLAVRRAGHVDRLLVPGSKHGAVDAPVVDAGIGVLADEKIVVGVGVAVAVVMQEER